VIPDILTVAVIALVSGVAVAGVGLLVLGRLRTRSVAASVSTVVVVAVLSVIVSLIAAHQAMIISTGDTPRLAVIVVVTGAISVACGSWLGRRLAADSMWADEMRERERALEASRREVVAWVSHDLRTPLAGMRAMTEALEDLVVSDPVTVHEYYRRLRQETDRMTVLVDDLFQLSRIHAGALRLTLEQVSLRDIVSDAVSGAGPIAAAKGVRVSADPTALPDVLGSESELNRVVRNLLDNAIRHSPVGEGITVRGGQDGDEVWLGISDACGGIPTEDLDRVFDLAFRGELARTPASDAGGGLGLAIARGLVEAHHGRITVGNEDGGCRFEVRLPTAAGPQDPDHADDTARTRPGTPVRPS